MITFNHIALNCLDLAAQEKFYAKHFGFKRCRTIKKGQPDEFFLMKIGAMRLELFSTDREKTVAMQGGEQPVGFKHFAFDVPKIEPILESLATEGIEPHYRRDCDDICPGLRIAFFRDPEGNIVELMEGYKDEE
jgi:glyoxylase I family protein